jgi:hypothetical protein
MNGSLGLVPEPGRGSYSRSFRDDPMIYHVQGCTAVLNGATVKRTTKLVCAGNREREASLGLKITPQAYHLTKNSPA